MAIKTFLEWQADTNYINGQIASAERLLKPVKAVKEEITEINSYLQAILNKDAGAWTPSFTYPAGTIVTSSNRYYRSLQAANYGRSPATEPTWWVALSYTDLPAGDSMNIDPIDLHSTVTSSGMVWFDSTAQQYKKVQTETNDKIIGWLDFSDNRIYTSGAIKLTSGNFWVGDYAVLETGSEGLICASAHASATNRKIGYILDSEIIYLDFTNHALDYLKSEDLKTVNGSSLVGSGNIPVGSLNPGDLKTINGSSLVGSGNIQITPDGGAYRIDVRSKGATWSGITAQNWAKASISVKSGDVISVVWKQYYTYGTGNGSATGTRTAIDRYIIRNTSWLAF